MFLMWALIRIPLVENTALELLYWSYRHCKEYHLQTELCKQAISFSRYFSQHCNVLAANMKCPPRPLSVLRNCLSLTEPGSEGRGPCQENNEESK